VTPASIVRRIVGREDPERFVEEVRSGDPELASYLRIEERELRRAGPNWRAGSSGGRHALEAGRRRLACAPLSPTQCVESASRLLCGACAEVGSKRTGEPTLGRVQLASDK
jgi:hypothetical protein